MEKAMVKITNVINRIIPCDSHAYMAKYKLYICIEYATRVEGLLLQSDVKSLFINAPVWEVIINHHQTAISKWTHQTDLADNKLIAHWVLPTHNISIVEKGSIMENLKILQTRRSCHGISNFSRCSQLYTYIELFEEDDPATDKPISWLKYADDHWNYGREALDMFLIHWRPNNRNLQC